MLAMNQDRVENQARTLPDIDTFMGKLFQNRTNGKPPVIPPEAVRMCNISISKPTRVPGVSMFIHHTTMNNDAGVNICAAWLDDFCLLGYILRY